MSDCTRCDETLRWAESQRQRAQDAERERDEARDRTCPLCGEMERALGTAHVNGVLDLHEGESLVDCAIRCGRERDEARKQVTNLRALLRELEWAGAGPAPHVMTTTTTTLTAVPARTLVPVDAPPASVQLGTLHATDAAGLIAAATTIAKPLAHVIETQHLYTNISGRRYVRCEGWTTLAAMLGVTPHEVSVTEHDGVYTAIVELRRLTDGRPVSRASDECGHPDEVWAKRTSNARRSMALTRATGKACRLAFSWVITLAGFEATPAEEMDEVEYQRETPRQTRVAKAAPETPA